MIENYIHVHFYSTAFKGCVSIVFIHGVKLGSQLGEWAADNRKFLSGQYLKIWGNRKVILSGMTLI